MIYHSIRVSIKPDAPADKLERALEHLRTMGREIPAVKFFCVGRDIGGEFDYGAMFALEDINAYREYMLAPIHRKTDEIGLPLVKNMISMDITDDPDPTIAEQIREVHSSRYASDPGLLQLVQDLNSYSGSGVPGKAPGRRG